MEFRFEEGSWISQATIRDRVVCIEFTVDDDTELPSVVTKVVEQVTSNWPASATALPDELLKTHNEHWADPVNGRSKLTDEEFLRKVVTESIHYESDEGEDGIDKETYTVYFSDSNIFGGHLIQVFGCLGRTLLAWTQCPARHASTPSRNDHAWRIEIRQVLKKTGTLRHVREEPDADATMPTERHRQRPMYCLRPSNQQ